MQKKKKGLWLFLFSLIPGAGEMYLGFRKQGISIMILFWALIGIAGGLNLGWLVLFLPVLWFYSFFNVHNLKSLPDDEFYSLEDSYILHMDQLFTGSEESLLKKHKKLLAILMIIFGIAILWNNLTDLLYWILPDFLARIIHQISYRIPQIIVAVLIVMGGFYILSDHKKRLDEGSSDTAKNEHYWEPYRPYEQPKDKDTQTDVFPQDVPTMDTPSFEEIFPDESKSDNN